ncbi:YXWGXW repeat-containing protein [Piscinibacter terrae]|uniref:YXWGXW repeat-containing protein n=1 Tax=Piscinibacter terrae TaxID=2496871 RepID=A0A3N7JZ43_9BURK|nr:YXWGXW repeat-containing protein [Albitalea terrae]RQP26049.1 hypothetical protein DZC73_03095 [Albitalea terrae]
MLKKTLIAACIAAAFTTIPAVSGAATTVWVRQAPPAVRVEEVPAPRQGFAWVPGHWEWRHGRYVWYRGNWVRERVGYAYAAPTWVEHNGRWQMQQGHWSRHDEDHDGVPNRHDHDRDGDGVRNSQDRHPDNPNRQ